MEEKEIIESGEKVTTGDEDLMSALKDMQKTHVPKERYEKEREEKKQLLQMLVKGERIEEPQAPQNEVNIDQLRKELYSGKSDLNNLEYVSKTLQLRKALIEKGERDPFLPVGDRVTVTADHYEKADQVAQLLEECVEFADGDSGIFTAEYQRRVKDNSILSRIKR